MMIYCVEDDPNIRELVVYTLNYTGLPAKGFPTGKEFMAAISDELPELVLLDIMLPGEDGIQILRDLRRNAATARTPVIMVTARGAEYEKVQALDLGADDYVTKPFGMMELVSRIRAVLRRCGSGRDEQEVLQIGKIEMNLKKHQVMADGELVNLDRKEYELLRKFLMNPEVVLTREQILSDIWGYAFDGETRTVDVHIRTLRQKLGETGSQIATVRGVGYKIVE